jgi:hypothetical protein
MGKVDLSVYAEKWIDQRAGLRPRTVDLYRWLLRKYIDPHLGAVQLGKLNTQMVRSGVRRSSTRVSRRR